MRVITNRTAGFYNTPADLQWIKEKITRDKILLPKFKSAVISGNEAAPGLVELFAKKMPDYRDSPVGFLVPHDEE